MESIKKFFKEYLWVPDDLTDEEYGKELYSACKKELGVPPMRAIELGSAVATNAGNHSIGILYYTGD